MKKILLFICFCAALACKKDSSKELVNQQFVLTSALVSPAMMVNGKAETNYMTMSGVSGCLNNNYTITFKADGVYTITSTGPLCDMIANLGTQKWSKDGDKITLTNPYTAPIVATLKGDKLVYTLGVPTGGVNYSVIYQFEAK